MPLSLFDNPLTQWFMQSLWEGWGLSFLRLRLLKSSSSEVGCVVLCHAVVIDSMAVPAHSQCNTAVCSYEG